MSEQQLCVVDFKKVVESYVSLTNEEKELKTQLKGIRSQKEEVSAKILEYMKNINVESVRLANGGRVVMKTTESKPKLSSKELDDIITSHAPSLKAVIADETSHMETKVKTSLVHKK